MTVSTGCAACGWRAASSGRQTVVALGLEQIEDEAAERLVRTNQKEALAPAPVMTKQIR